MFVLSGKTFSLKVQSEFDRAHLAYPETWLVCRSVHDCKKRRRKKKKKKLSFLQDSNSYAILGLNSLTASMRS
jgi:hypothetical protein